MKSVIYLFSVAILSTGFASGTTAGVQLNSLRSAHLQRALGELQPINRRDIDSIKHDLQSHFNSVLELLDGNASVSLEVALSRLEQQQGVKWSSDQRNYWKTFLSRNRSQNIQRLIAYRNRGLFPQNEGHSLKAIPIFVDRHDTACAVGHLMRESGWKREVDLIEATNLYVYVPDVKEGPLVSWVLQSGLTQEEAALIQPSYPFNVDQNLTAIAQANSSVQSEGLVYSEFTTSATGPLGARFGAGFYAQDEGFLPNVSPLGTNWVIVGGFLPTSDALIYDAGNELLTLKFRLRGENPSTRFNRLDLETNYFESGFGVLLPNNFSYQSFNSADSNYQNIYKYAFGIDVKIKDLVTLQEYLLPFTPDTINESPFGGTGNGTASLEFPAASDLLVEITASYSDLTSWGMGLGKIGLGTYVVHFNAIPEPTCFAALSLGLICLVGYRSRRGKV